MLRGAAPNKGCVVWSTAARVEIVSVKELEWRRAESKAGISSSRTRQRLGRGPSHPPTPTSPFQKPTTTFQIQRQPSLASHSTLRIVPYFIDHGVRGGAMAKPTSLSVPIGPGLHVVRLSGRGFGQTLVRTAHTAVSGFGKVEADAAFIANFGILPQKTRLRIQWVVGGTLW